jgi:hypothetical protein
MTLVNCAVRRIDCGLDPDRNQVARSANRLCSNEEPSAAADEISAIRQNPTVKRVSPVVVRFFHFASLYQFKTYALNPQRMFCSGDRVLCL